MSPFYGDPVQKREQRVQSAKAAPAVAAQLPAFAVQRALANPLELSATDVLQLQHTAGNQAVAHLLGREGVAAHVDLPTRPALQRTVAPVAARTPARVIQRFKNPFARNKEGSTKVKRPHVPPNVTAPVEEAPTEANRFVFTMAVKRVDENFLTKSAKFSVGKLTRKFGLNVGPEEAPTDTGHAWVELKTFKDDTPLSSNSYGLGKAGFMHPDSYAGSKGDETFFKDHPISADVYARVLDRLNEVKQKVDSGEVKYQAFGYNCAAFVRDITRTAGLPFPGSKVIPFIFHGKASAFTPNRLFSALNKQYSKGGSGVYHIDDPDAGLGGEPAEATDEEVEDLFAQMRANKAAKQPGGGNV